MRFLIDECCDPRLGTALPARLAVLVEGLDDKLLGAITVLDDHGRRRAAAERNFGYSRTAQ